MDINKNLTTVNYNSGGGTSRVKYIVIHYTANDGDTAWGNTNYFKSVNRGASAHYFVDENSIWQCVEDQDIAWHCGTSGVYKHPYCRNSNSIGVEMCSRKYSGGTFYFKDATVTNAVELTKLLMKRYGIPAGNVIRHYDVTGKVCPEPFVRNPNEWNAFKTQLTSNTGGNTNTGGEPEMTESQVKAIAESAAKAAVDNHFKNMDSKSVSTWATEFWKEAVSTGVFDGTMPQGNLTREQAATTYSKMGLLELSKHKEVSEWAKDSWNRAVSLGIVDGSAPAGPMTREQFVVVLMKLGLL